MPTIIEALLGQEDVLDSQSNYSTVFLADKPKTIKGDKADPKTASVGRRDTERISGVELERAYRVDSFVFNAVNVAVQMIMSAGYTIKAKKAAVRKFFEEFIANVSKVGADATFDEMLVRIFQDAYVHGGAWDEIVWNVEDTKPVDLKTLNPVEMDFARDGNGNVVLDENEKPVGYVQNIPYGVSVEGKGDEVPESVTLGENKIFILPKRISYIPLYTFGAGFVGIGRVEPAYQATIWKLNLLKAGAESTSRRGFSPIIAKVGNETVHPTPQMIQDILDSVKKLDFSRYMAMPWYVELTTLDVKSIETYEGFLKYLTAMQSAALGVPVPFVTGLGEETNRATLGTQLQVFELSLNTIASRICRSIEKYIFRPISEAEGFDEVPIIEWGLITTLPEKAKMGNAVKKDKEITFPDKTNDEKKKLEMTGSSSVSGNPLDTSHQNQGVSYPKDMTKGKVKSTKKKKV
ncbi:MAG: hypothetical protein ABIB43_01690 [archaeon]